MIDSKIIGKRLLILRKKYNMSRTEVAKLCAISKSEFLCMKLENEYQKMI